jgi:probable rRNA maturation factor
MRAYLSALGLGKAGVTLRLVDGRESRGLNRRFRRRDRATDVLSFPASDGAPRRGFSGYLGDLALCPPYAWRKRGRFDPDFGGEAAYLVLHGLLHLSGRHHDTSADERALWRLSARLHPLGGAWFADLRRLAPVHPSTSREKPTRRTLR